MRVHVMNYKLTTPAGKHIRMATEVILPGGKTVRFTERLSQKEAVRQAKLLISRG